MAAGVLESRLTVDEKPSEQPSFSTKIQLNFVNDQLNST